MGRPRVWLRSNRRAIGVAALLPALTILASIPLWTMAAWWAWVLGALLLTGGVLVAVSLGVVWFTPLLAVENGDLLVYLGWSSPQRVPLEVVECVFLGQHETNLPDLGGSVAKAKAVVIRLAESAREYHHRPVRPSLGRWQDGYIVIQGLWTEPITVELVQKMNDQLRLWQAHHRRHDQVGSEDRPGNMQEASHM